MLSHTFSTRAFALAAIAAIAPLPALADNETIEEALRAAHPLFAQAEWSDARGEGTVPELRGQGVLETSASATDLRLVLPWRASTVTAQALHVVGDDVVLEGLRLENSNGTVAARRAHMSREALGALGHILSGEAPEGEEADAAAGTVRLAGFTIETVRHTRERGDGRTGRFQSTMRGEWLALDGIAASGRANPTLVIDGVTAERVVGQTVFAGEAGFTLERLEARLTGESPVMGLVQEAMLRALGTSDGAASGTLSLVVEGFDLTVTGREAGAEPVRALIGRASVEGELAEDGATRVAVALREAATTPNIAAGTPLETAMRMAAREAQTQSGDGRPLLDRPHVPADVDISASLNGRELVVDADSRVPGLATGAAALDATLPEGGLAKVAGGGRDAAMALALETTVRTIRLDFVDRGLDTILAEETGERIVARLRSAIGGAGDGGGGMRGMALQLALAQAAGVLEILEREGSVRMQVTSPVALPLPVALVTLLQSAAPVPQTR